MKPLRTSFIALCAAFVFFGAAVMYQKTEKKPQIIGGYTFAQSYGRLINSNKIVLNDGKNKFSLIMKDGNWRIEERNMYFADHNIVNFLASAISRSRIKNFQSEGDEDFEFVPEWYITIYDGEKVLDEIAVKKNVDGRYLGKISGNDELYEFSGYFDFPHEYKVWLVQPLVSIKADDIYEVKYGDNSIRRNLEDNSFSFSKEEDKDKLFAALSQLAYLDFSNAERTEEIKGKSDITTFSVELFSGLIYNFEIYTANDKYFVELKADVAPASDFGTKEYVEQNKVLYDGWAFELDPERYEIFSALK